MEKEKYMKTTPALLLKVKYVILDIQKMVWKLVTGQQYNSLLMLVKVYSRFFQNPLIAILELLNCLGQEWLTFLKRCYCLVRQEYNKHVRAKVLICAKSTTNTQKMTYILILMGFKTILSINDEHTGSDNKDNSSYPEAPSTVDYR